MKPTMATAKPARERLAKLAISRRKPHPPLSIFPGFANGSKNGQLGGTTILVVLTLLVLLTVAGLSMSKNSLKEIQATAFVKQGAMARQVADSGIEWAFYWIDLSDTSGSAELHAKLIALKNGLARDNSLSGTMWSLNSNPGSNSYSEYKQGSRGPDQILTPPGSVEESGPDYALSYTIGLTRMGKLPVANMSQGGAYNPASGGANLQAPDLWAIRSDARVKPANGGSAFTQAREMWVSTPVR
jgi:hypothetical protein